jgi:L-rhamnose mutarotase
MVQEVFMQRIATYMAVKPGMEARYRQEPEHIWPEVPEGITRFGIRDDCIYLLRQNLFTYYQAQDLGAASARLAAGPAYRVWHAPLAHCIDQQGSAALDEVFYAA